MNKNFKAWMIKAETEHKAKLALLAKTSVGHLYQLASGDRRASAELAGKIETAMVKMKTDLPIVTRADLCDACAKCPYAKQCLSTKRGE